jgi:tetratricopeptide (TPR) repeat protein
MNAEPTPAVALPADAAASTLPSRASASQSRGLVLAVCAALIGLTFAVFAQTCWFDFVNYDDNIAVYENPFVRAGLTAKGLTWAFSFNDYEYWIPLTSISHMVDAQLFGLRAGGHHFTNVLLHAASVVLLFLALRRLTGAFWRAAFVAAVFAIHPLRAESIGWVVERKDLLAGVFFMLALFFYGPGLKRGIAVMACFILGFLSKPMVITLPFLLLLLDYWPGGRISKLSDWKKPVLEKLPMLLLIPFLAVLTVITQGHAPGALQTLESNSMAARIGNALMSCVIYIKQTFYPIDLVVFYSRTEEHHAIWMPMAAAVMVAAITAVAVIYRRKHPFLICGWFWYLGMLVPVLGIISIGHMAHADRYTYFPQIGVCIMVAWGAVELFGKSPVGRRTLAALAIAAVAILSVLGFSQTKYWRNSETLWNHTLAVNPKSLLAHNNLATVLYDKRDVDGALAHLESAVEINPRFAQAQNNLGMILSNVGRVDEAIGHFEKCLEADPKFAEGHNNFGSALRKQRKLDDAIAHFQKATELDPKYALAWYNLGKTLLVKGDLGLAGDAYLRGMEIQPEFVANRAVQKDIYQIAWSMATSPEASARNGSKAIRLAEQGYLHSKGGGALALTALAAGYAESGQFQNAVSTAQRALQMAQAQGDSALSSAVQEQMKSYEAKTPFREMAKQ